jgi:hypothetical protein
LKNSPSGPVKSITIYCDKWSPSFLHKLNRCVLLWMMFELGWRGRNLVVVVGCLVKCTIVPPPQIGNCNWTWICRDDTQIQFLNGRFLFGWSSLWIVNCELWLEAASKPARSALPRVLSFSWLLTWNQRRRYGGLNSLGLQFSTNYDMHQFFLNKYLLKY